MHAKFTRSFFLLVVFAFVSIGSTIDLNDLFDYENQIVPAYIVDDNTPVGNSITNAGATLGRVLFYDKNLSNDQSISCASCHQQENAFGDAATLSTGWQGGQTGRHSMRLVNARFAEEERFFWDERAVTLEEQTTQPIQDHIEMGFSGADGDLSFSDLEDRLEALSYYQELFTYVYGDAQVTEERIQNALAQFVRSMQSFDSKYDTGRAQVNNNNAPFPNFTPAENAGKMLFMRPPAQGGAGCNGCHNAPEFGITDNSGNNGVIGVAGDPAAVDLTNTRSPSLRDVVDGNGNPNGPFMHDGSLATLLDVVNHYNDIDFDVAVNPDLDNRLRGGPGGNGQNLNLTDTEKDNLVAFLETLTGTSVYTAAQWSDPFDINGNLTILNGVLPVTWADFSAENEDTHILLAWTTAAERDNYGFHLQRSADAFTWTDLTFVPGAGDSYSTTDYRYDDLTPLTGRSYYRLKQEDYDGSIRFSHTVSIERKQDFFESLLFPNPVVDELTLSLSPGLYRAELVDATGKTIRRAELTGTAKWSLEGQATGIYLLSVEDLATGRMTVRRVIRY